MAVSEQSRRSLVGLRGRRLKWRSNNDRVYCHLLQDICCLGSRRAFLRFVWVEKTKTKKSKQNDC